MHPFDVLVASNLHHLLQMLTENPSARLVAGATDFIPFVRAGKWRPSLVIDISRVRELRYCSESDGWLQIGACMTLAELVSSSLIRRVAPVLAQAAGQVGDCQVRARATLGGNICTASPAADTVPALLVLDAQVVLTSQAGTRHMPLNTFLLGPGRTALGSGELLAGVRLPVPDGRTGTAFLKLGRRRSLAISVANAAALIVGDGNRISRARLALGAVAPTVVRCPTVEQILVGRAPNEILFAEASAHTLDTVRPIDDVRASAEYRRVVSVSLARRAFVEAWKQVGDGHERSQD